MAAVESIKEFFSWAADYARSLLADYQAIFGAERLARGTEFAVFALVHSFLFVPLAAHFLEASQPGAPLAVLLGTVWCTVSYPVVYSDQEAKGLLALRVRDYLRTRLIALAGSWVMLVAAPLFLLYSLRWIVLPLVALRLLLFLLSS